MSTIEQKTVTRTTYDGGPVSMRPASAIHHLVIQRSSAIKTGSSSPSVNRSVTVDKTTGGMSPAEYHSIVETGVGNVKTNREEEKKQMQDLNERFGNYIEKVRYLEAQNKKLADDLAKLREKWGKETAQIKAMFQADLDEARRALDDAEKDKAQLEIRAASLEEQIEELQLLLREAAKESAEYKDRILHQTQLLADYQNEIEQLRKRIDQMETDADKDKKMIQTLTDALKQARQDLDDVTLSHIDSENRRQTLEEEIEFLKSVHEQEMKELQALISGDSAAENRDFWKNELQNAIREIQRMYEEKMDTMKTELENHYTYKVQDFKVQDVKKNMDAVKNKDDSTKIRNEVQNMRDSLGDLNAKNADLLRKLEQLRREKDDWERGLEDENNRLRGDISQVRSELEAILQQLRLIMDSKMGLELEIAAYRKLLEGEENRLDRKGITDGQNYSNAPKKPTLEEEMGSLAKGEMSARTTYQRSAKGPITITDCPPDGKFIRIENTGRKDENVAGWKIRRTVDNREIPEFELGDNFSSLKPGAKMTIYARGQKPASASATDSECELESWGIGAQATTKLVNLDGDDRATHVMKTVYSS